MGISNEEQRKDGRIPPVAAGGMRYAPPALVGLKLAASPGPLLAAATVGPYLSVVNGCSLVQLAAAGPEPPVAYDRYGEL